MCAYRSGEYAASLAEFGRPLPLVRSGGWLLERPIPGSVNLDAAGPYPLFACRDWRGLAADLGDLLDPVSVVLVADPFGDHSPELLAATFNRGAQPFKRHHVVELKAGPEVLAGAHHRRNARKALGLVDVTRVEVSSEALDDWIGLYDVLIRRHQIRGVARFSAGSFARLFAMPGLVAFRAEAEGATVGMVLWLVEGDVAYYHLGAYDEAGYARNASFALFWRSIEWFQGRLQWLDLGAGAGLGDGSGGLDRFKAGWSTSTRLAYLCRHVVRPDRYRELSAGLESESFFPAYRAPSIARGVPA